MSVSLTYDRNGATGGSVPVDATAYTAGASVTVQGNEGALNLAGYIFAAWNTKADGSDTAYLPGSTFLIAADTTLYAVWNSATSLITPTELREHMASALTDAALQRIIDAEEAEIVTRFGETAAAQVEEFEEECPGSLIFPKRRAQSVSSIVELWPDRFIGGLVPLTLDATDYEIVPGGKQVRRLDTGAHPSREWGGRVTLTYVPVVETSKRVLALINLCKLNLQFNGLDSESVGGGEYRMDSGDYDAKREKILAGLGSAQRSLA
jgi:hypothetical protein